MPFHLLLSVLTLVVLLTSSAAGSQDVQVILEYGSGKARIHSVAQIPPIAKRVRTPGVIGAPAIVEYNAEWLDGTGRVLATTITEIPLMIRVPSDQNAAGVCELVPCEDGVVALRMQGPDDLAAAKALRLTRIAARRLAKNTATLPSSFQLEELSLDLPDHLLQVEKEGPISSEKVIDTGPDSNRFVLVVLGDGYTQQNLDAGLFESHVTGFLNDFAAKEPWDVYRHGINVYRVDVVSNEEGSDNIDNAEGPKVDTYFNSQFWAFGIERLMNIDSTGQIRAILAANEVAGQGVWDQLLLLVNSTKYGGAGGFIAISSVHPSASEIVLHELGHSFAGLADEYSDPYPGFPPGDSEPNVSYISSGPELKWLPWVEEGTPLPTPDTSAFNTVVGAFEGARYLTTGIFRPWRNCLMRTLGREFCPVCREAHVSSYFDLVEPIDIITPEPGSVVSIPGQQTAEFHATPVPTGAWSYEWNLGGVTLAEQGNTLTLSADQLPLGDTELSVTVIHDTQWMRLETISQTRSWTVRPRAIAPSDTWMIH